MRWAGLWLVGVLLAGCQVATPAESPTGVFAISRVSFVVPEASPSPVVTPSASAPAEAPSASPSPSPSPSSRSRGGGSASVPRGPADVVFENGFTLQRLAGDAAGGGALGTDALSARFMAVAGLTVAPDGTVYLADPVRHEVRAVPPSGPTRVVAGLGDGRSGYMGDNVLADSTALHTPMGICRDPLTGAIVVADSGNDRLRLFTRGGRIYTLAGGGASTSDAVANPLSARLSRPFGLTADGTGKLSFTERTTGRVRQLGATGGVTTVATLTPGAVGPVAARWDGLRVWVGDGGTIRLMRPGTTPALEPVAVATFVDAEVIGLAYDQAGGLYVSVTAPGTGGRSGARVYRVAVGDDGLSLAGRVPEWVAGSGGVSTEAADYAAPLAATRAESVLLGGAWHGQLAIDLTYAADPTRLGGHLYLGSSVEGEFGQVVKLTPLE